jgi:hypothetical protein
MSRALSGPVPEDVVAVGQTAAEHGEVIGITLGRDAGELQHALLRADDGDDPASPSAVDAGYPTD